MSSTVPVILYIYAAPEDRTRLPPLSCDTERQDRGRTREAEAVTTRYRHPILDLTIPHIPTNFYHFSEVEDDPRLYPWGSPQHHSLESENGEINQVTLFQMKKWEQKGCLPLSVILEKMLEFHSNLNDVKILRIPRPHLS